MASKLLPFLLASLFTTLTIAEPIIGTVYNATCILQGYPTVVGNQTCFNDPTGAGGSFPAYSIPEAFATSSVSNSFTSVHGTGRAFGAGITYPDSVYIGEVAASSDFSVSSYLATIGPIRPGILKATLTSEGTTAAESGDNAGSFLNISLLRNSNAFAFGPGIGCSQNYIEGSCQSEEDLLNYFNSHEGFAVQLGTPFVTTYTGGVHSSAGGPTEDSTYGYATLEMTIRFSLFEADGITPVEVVSAAPEPAGWALLLFSISVLVLCRHLRLSLNS